MIVLLPSPHDIKIILRNQKKTSDSPLRFISFCVQHDVPDGRLLYNTLTKELLLLESGDEEKSEVLDFLFQHWYLVPQAHNDRKLADELQSIAQVRVQKKQNGRIDSFTILTTTDCNARCFYCYERGIRHEHMPDNIAVDTARYIAQSSGGQSVSLHWFGGEPLYNQQAIDVICRELSERGIQYRSDMISNAFLFDPDMVRKAREQWKLHRVQVTLDGTEEIYNRRKAYINPVGSPFQRVIENIHLLLDADIRVTIRLNLDRQNEQNLYQLCDFLAEEFGACKNLKVYPSLLSSEAIQGEDEADMCLRLSNLEDYISEKLSLSATILNQSIKTNQCMADNSASVVILPNGDLHSCDRLQSGYAWGNINSSEIKEESRDYFRQRLLPIPKCDTCAYYPNCVRLACCPLNTGACSLMAIQRHERTVHRSIVAYWQAYMKKNTEKEA